MPWGFRAETATGKVQIASSVHNYALREVRTVTTASSYPTNSLDMSQADVSYTSATTPFIAIGGTTAPTCLYYMNKSGSTWTWHIRALGLSQQMKVYIFDVADAITTPGWGLRTKDAATGQVRFDSRHKYPFAIDTIAGALANVDSAIAARSYPGLSVAVMQNRLPCQEWRYLHSISDFYAIEGGARAKLFTAGNSVSFNTANPYFNWTEPASPSDDVFDIENLTYSYLVIDVTGF